MEPVTLLSSGLAGKLMLWLVDAVAGGALGNLADRQACAAFLDYKNRLPGLRRLPENHDVAKAIRVAQLQALDRVLRDFRDRPRPEWNRTLHLRPDAFVDACLAYCRRGIHRVSEHVIVGTPGGAPDVTGALVAAIDGILAAPEDDGPARRRVLEIARRAEDGVLDELRRVPGAGELPEGFEAHFRSGAGDERRGFLELFGRYAGEQLKGNSRFHDILTTAQLSGISLIAFDIRSLVQRLDDRFGAGLVDVRTAIREQSEVLTDVRERLTTMADQLERAGQRSFGDVRRPATPPALEPAAPPRGAGTGAPRNRVSNIGGLLPRNFLGRDEEIEGIREALQRYAGRVAIIALTGMRGCGKSTLARVYAVSHRRDYRVTWWLRAATPQGIEADLTALAVELGWFNADEREDAPIAAIVERLEDEAEGMLLVYDNAVDADVVQAYLPRGGSAHVLITSTMPLWGAIAEPITLRLWPANVGADFLLSRSGRKDVREDAARLSDACEGLPLALEIAAAYCERMGISLREYLRRFEREGVAFIDKGHSPEAFHDRLSVTKAFQLSIGDASADNPAAEPFIVHCALLPPEPIPLFLFREGRQHLVEPLGTLLADDGVDEAVATLRMLSLIERAEVRDERDRSVTTEVVRLHRFVRDVAASRWPADARMAAARGLIAMLAAVYPSDDLFHVANWPRARRLDRLAWGLVGDGATLPAGSELAASELMMKLAAFRHASDNAYAQVRFLYERALAVRMDAVGPAHPAIAESLNGLALLHWAQGDLESARRLCERALLMREAEFGPTHASVAESYMNLGRILRDLHHLDDARGHCERALSVYRAVSGPDHTDVALCLSTLVRVLIAGADFRAALPLSREALSIYERALEPENPAIAATLINVGIVAQGTGDALAAVSYFERALAIHEHALGPTHLTVASTLVRLAAALDTTHEPARARSLLERALQINERSLGEAHQKTALVRELLERLSA